MRKNILGICDAEQSYSSRFATYLSNHNFEQFHIMLFSNVAFLQNYLNEHEVQMEILLIAESSYEENIKELPITKIILLKEEGDFQNEQIASINKYQSVAVIMQEVFRLYAQDDQCTGILPMNQNKTRLIGFYSPGENDLTHSCAETFAECIASEKKVLYLNLSTYLSIQNGNEERDDYDIGDMIYYLKQNEEKVIYKMESIKNSYRGLDYIPPILFPEDLKQITKDEWLKLIRCIIMSSNYEIVVLDLGEVINGLFDLMQECDNLISIVEDNPIQKRKIMLFAQMCREKGWEEILEKIRQVEIERNNQPVWKTEVKEMIAEKMRELIKQYADYDI